MYLILFLALKLAEIFEKEKLTRVQYIAIFEADISIGDVLAPFTSILQESSPKLQVSKLKGGQAKTSPIEISASKIAIYSIQVNFSFSNAKANISE